MKDPAQDGDKMLLSLLLFKDKMLETSIQQKQSLLQQIMVLVCARLNSQQLAP